MIGSLYPGEELDALPAPFATKGTTKNFERVTTYGDEEEPPRSTRLCVDAELLHRFKEVKAVFVESCDSFALYRHREIKWVACTVPHERICLVRDAALFEELRLLGLAVSKEPPAWW